MNGMMMSKMWVAKVVNIMLMGMMMLGMEMIMVRAQDDVPTVSSVRICVYGNGIVGNQDQLLAKCREELATVPPFVVPEDAICADYPNNFCVLGTGRLRPVFEAARMNCFPRTTTDKCGGFRTDQWQYNISASVPPTECILNEGIAPNRTFVTNPNAEFNTFGCFPLFSNQAFRFECSECLAQPECFSDGAMVRTLEREGSIVSKPLAELVPGDRVESFSELDGEREFATLMNVEHGDVNLVRDILLIHHTKNHAPLRVTPSHLLRSADAHQGMIVAQDVKPGINLLVMGESGTAEASKVTRVGRASGRVLNPQTENMRIVVDGVLASCWTDVSIGGVSLARLPGLTAMYKVLSKLRLFSVVRYIDEAVHRIYSAL